MKIFRPVIFLSTALVATAAPLTLDDALARAVAQHPRLLAHDARAEAAAALAEQAAYRPNPEVSVSLENFAGTTRRLDGLEGTVEVSQTIERGDKLARRIALAEQDRATLAAETGVTRSHLLQASAQAYVATVIATQRVKLAEDFVALARTALDDAEKRRAAGDASAAEPARARAALAAALAESARQSTALQTARIALAALWGGEPADATPATEGLRLPDTAPDASGWLALLDSHPQLRLAEARVGTARARAQLAQANATPDVRLTGGLRYLRENSEAALVAGLSVPLPVRHRNQGALRAARQELTGAEHETAAVARELRTEVATAVQELTAAHAAALRLRREVLPAAEEAAALLRRAYAAGQATQLEVLDAERVHREVHRELLDQEAAYATALVHTESLLNPALPLTRQLLATP